MDRPYAMHSPPLYCPPRPKPLSPLGGLIRTALSGEGNLLSLLPAAAYKMPVGYLGYSRRSILIINDPVAARSIMTDPSGIYPKNDLMVGALEPLVGDSIFVSSGETWQRQRRMIDPAFTLIRINRAFEAMRAAVDDYEDHLDGLAESGETFSLDLAMSHLTADIICRTVFTTPLKSETAKAVYEDFALFERSVSHVELKRLIFDKPWSKVPQHEEVLAACQRIRQHLGELLDSHLEEGGRDYNDIASAIITARDPESGEGFTREELIDQLGVFFLAGHETTASVLTWVFFIAATQPEVLARLRAEVEEVVGAGEVIMISPWTMHRHEAYWDNPHAFDPDRFSPDRESRITQAAYIPFGQGPRVCIGAAFATVESALILARLLRRFDFEVLEPEKVRPVARLTTRPAEQIRLKVRRAAG